MDAIKETVGDETEIIYEQNPSTDTLERSDISFAIVAVGEPPYAESMGDNSELLYACYSGRILLLLVHLFLS